MEDLIEKKKIECACIFKKFRRFLKEEGRYTDVMKYLFPPGRTLDDFFNKWIFSRTYKDDGDLPLYILNIADVLGPSYKKEGYFHWKANIKELSVKWNKLNGIISY